MLRRRALIKTINNVNNVIHYTATAKVEEYSSYPWSFDTFGANILSHDFNEESGEGVITFDADVTTIGAQAFRACTNLTSITIPDSVTTIGVAAFLNCALTSIVIPNSVTEIRYAAFRACPSLTSVTIPNSVFYIEDQAFYSCSGLSSVTIPYSVKGIGNEAFRACSRLTTVYCNPTTPPTLGGTDVFTDTQLSNIYVPSMALNSYKHASRWSNYEKYIISL